MKALSIIGVALGLAAVGALLAWQGAARVLEILEAMGWGFALLPLLWLPYLAISAASFNLLFGADRGPGLGLVMRAFWFADSVGTLVPGGGVGPVVVKVRILMQAALSGVQTSAALVLDKTVEALSLLAWGLIGALCLAAAYGGAQVSVAAFAGSALLGAGIAGFIAVQRAGAFGYLAERLARIAGLDNWRSLLERAAEVDALIIEIYRRRGRLALSCALRLVGRAALTGELLVAAALMGHPISLVDALILRSLTSALRGAAFVVPAGLGVQEGGFIALGAVVGLQPEFMLALSLAGRARELLVAVPGLLAWQQAEGRALFRRLGPARRRRAPR